MKLLYRVGTNDNYHDLLKVLYIDNNCLVCKMSGNGDKCQGLLRFNFFSNKLTELTKSHRSYVYKWISSTMLESQ